MITLLQRLKDERDACYAVGANSEAYELNIQIEKLENPIDDTFLAIRARIKLYQMLEQLERNRKLMRK